MIVVAVHHFAALGPVRDDQHWDTRTVAKEVERYERARIPKAASLVEGDEQHRVFVLILFQLVSDLFDHRLEKMELAGCPSTRLSGFTYATDGSWPLSSAWKKSIASLMCAWRCCVFPMIALE